MEHTNMKKVFNPPAIKRLVKLKEHTIMRTNTATTRCCPICKQDYVPNLVKEPGFAIKFLQWRGGELIQNVWPKSTAIDREQLQSGICSDKCWDSLFGEDE